jgi:hypothetical protein
VAIQVEITILSDDTMLSPTSIVVPCRFRTTTDNSLRSLSVTLDQSGLTPSNFVSGFKNGAAAALLSGYSINVNSNEVVVYGAPQ